MATSTIRQAEYALPGWAKTLKNLFRLTKPVVTLLLVFTAVMTAVFAAGPWVDPAALLALAVSGGLAAAGAGAINHYLEKDLDRRMPRTAGRPLPSGALPDDRLALAWGAVLCLCGLGISLATLPRETTLLIYAGILVYVVVYTMWLKRRSTLNVVIGGAAGALPVLAGWSVTRLDWPLLPFALALVVFFWTPAHFWAFAIYYRKDYRDGGFPMLPNVIGPGRTIPFIFLHALLAVLFSVIALKGIPLVIAAVSGAAFLVACIVLWARPSPRKAYRVYKISNYYLLLVFLGLLF